jgi:hypothetical protein
MKKFNLKWLSAPLLLLSSAIAYATISVDQSELMNNHMGPVARQVQLGTELLGHQVAKFEWDPSSVSAHRPVGAVSLGVQLPAKAVIVKSWFQVVASLVSASNNGTIAFHCEDAGNIFAAADIDSTLPRSLTMGVSDGAVANMKDIEAACNITATVGTNAFTAGKIIGWAEFVVSE